MLIVLSIGYSSDAGFPSAVRWQMSVNTSNNTHHISIIFPRALPRAFVRACSRAVIIIPAACSIGRAILRCYFIFENKSRVFSRARRDYDSCNKPISIGRHTMAAPLAEELQRYAIYAKGKSRLSLSHFLPFFFIPTRMRIKLFDEFANGAGIEMIIAPDSPCIPVCLSACLLPDLRTRRRPPADSLA